ncbi:uncharacterized protein AMSG_02719 [Thecamonas trahens ATCC 50062]|uniref:Uncharacterized protein n=1 Tax=Thecamonas trahens ATCC 50062 TaxID=461836 RepID=A0A0L0D234_THETB|nr:hypothetical protein AMSG_02719 [Thecamonas trahens ATCC 50062]KNC46266.1 hypothetical protein AMSG_02719 [Thecamonas trahens ATCC 50062]|eukprot:XP_013760560.1 hypothetical protein AMSG_02719 [Thecamonas trahens ATCC 50062]
MLDEPLFGTPLALVPYEMAALCAELHVLLDAELEAAGTDYGRHVWDDGSALVNEVIDRMHSVAACAEPELDLGSYMAHHGLDVMYPIVADRLGLPLPDSEDRHMRDYFPHMALLHQIVTLADQLEADLILPNHKYYAHQIALLYSLFVQAGMKGSRFKKRIEGMFDEIKDVTEGQDVPQLSDELKETIRDMAYDVRDAISRFPSKLTRRLSPMRKFITQHPVGAF